MDLRDIAVTVRELPDGKYQWMLLEGTGETGTFAAYARLEISERLFDRYSDALIVGFSALRAIAGADGPRQKGGWDTSRY